MNGCRVRGSGRALPNEHAEWQSVPDLKGLDQTVGNSIEVIEEFDQ